MKRLKRFGAITSVLVKHGFGDIVPRIFGRAEEKTTEQQQPDITERQAFPSPHRIRLVLEELGPSFIKLGQLLSTRADLFPPEYIEEFRKLQDQVPPVPFEAIKNVIESDLERPLSIIFKEFEPDSIAAASVSQVHKARLHSGEQVAVKIVRPEITEKIRHDIGLMYYFAHKIEKAFQAARALGAVNLVKEFERTIFHELDMFIESGNIEKFSSRFKEIDEIHIPAVYWEYTAKSVLVMEYIDGIKMDQVDELKANNIDPKEIALIGLRSFSRQLMEFGYFHADPHPANTLVMLDGRVCLVDFGITGYLEKETMRQIANIFLGYAEHDYDQVMTALTDLGLVDEDTVDLKSFRRDLKDVSEPFYGRSLKTIYVKDVYDQVMQLVYRHQIRLPRNVLLLLKTFVQTESLGKILDSDASILEVTKPFAKKLLQEGYDSRKVLRNLHQDMLSMGSYLQVMPKFIHDILKQTSQGKQGVAINHRGFENLSVRMEKGMNRFIIGLIVAASLIASSLILNSGQEIFEFSMSLAGGRKVSLSAVLGVTGYVMATVLGIWLIISILRSGKL